MHRHRLSGSAGDQSRRSHLPSSCVSSSSSCCPSGSPQARAPNDSGCQCRAAKESASRDSPTGTTSVARGVVASGVRPRVQGERLGVQPGSAHRRFGLWVLTARVLCERMLIRGVVMGVAIGVAIGVAMGMLRVVLVAGHESIDRHVHHHDVAAASCLVGHDGSGGRAARGSMSRAGPAAWCSRENNAMAASDRIAARTRGEA